MLYMSERVLAYNPKTHKMELEPILHVWINHDHDLVDLTITTTMQGQHGKAATKTGEVVHTNQKHPFLTIELGFLPVGQITLGMHLLRADRRVGVVTEWKVVSGIQVMYNLEVAQDHTFTVGAGQWVVHNCGFLNADGTLKNFDKAIIDLNKILNYSLKEENKARVFERALGYNQSNYKQLIQQIFDNPGKYQAKAGLVDKYGSRFSVTMDLTGPNGKTAKVLTAWIFDSGSDIPRLISAYVDK